MSCRRASGSTLTDILISQFVRKSHPLRLMLDRFSVHNGGLELFQNTPVDGVTLNKCCLSSDLS